MPYTDEFLSNYAGWQDSPHYLFEEPNPLNGRQTNTGTLYNPLKLAGQRIATAIFYNQELPALNELAAIYPGRRSSAPRQVITYAEAVSDWDSVVEEQKITLTFDSFTVSNPASNTIDYIFDGVQLIDGLGDPSITETITLTRDGDINTFPRYTFVEDFMMHEFSQVRLVSSPTNVFNQIKTDPRRSEFVSDAIIGDTFNDLDTVDVYVMGVFDIARFNFPSTIIVPPGQTIGISLGTVDFFFYAEAMPTP